MTSCTVIPHCHMSITSQIWGKHTPGVESHRHHGLLEGLSPKAGGRPLPETGSLCQESLAPSATCAEAQEASVTPCPFTQNWPHYTYGASPVTRRVHGRFGLSSFCSNLCLVVLISDRVPYPLIQLTVRDPGDRDVERPAHLL